MSDIDQISRVDENGVNPADSYSDETVIFIGRPSQWVNFGVFLWNIICVAAGSVSLYLWVSDYQQGFTSDVEHLVSGALAMVVCYGILRIIYKIISVYCQKTNITHNKIKESRGILIFKEALFAEIADITDIKSPASGLLGVVGRCNLVIETSDADQPIITIRAITIAERERLITVLQPLWRRLRIERRGYFGG